MKKFIVLAGAVALMAGFGFIKREPLMLGFLDWRTEKSTLEERIALLKPAINVYLPEGGAAPYPVVLQFHGCGGMKAEFHDLYAKVATDAGYAAMVVDSHRPRGITRDEAYTTVCAGKTLLGQERAGDVLAAINIASDDPTLDADAIILAGWSHGGWSVMDFLTYAKTRLAPAGIVSPALDVPEIAGAIVFYPYCGTGARSRFAPWRQSPPVLALIAGEDTIVNADQCIAYFDKRQKAGAPVQMIVYPGAEHIFDDQFLPPDYRHWYNRDHHSDAVARYHGFLVEAFSAVRAMDFESSGKDVMR